MKKISLSICLTIMSVIAFAQWTILNPAPISNDLNSVYFLDDTTGYTVGESGTILKTIDAGNHWTQLNSGTLKNLNSVYFTNLNTGYVAGDSGCILKTIDGGSNWTPQYSGAPVSIGSICFVNANIGYAVGDSMVFSTQDGGIHWTGQSLLGTDYNEYLWLNSVYFANLDTGFAVGTGMWGFLHFGGKVYKTTNGGLDWALCHQVGGEYCSFKSAFFTDANTGYIGGYLAISETSHIHFFNKTTDGGLTWTGSNCGYTPIAIYFPTAVTGYFLAEDDETFNGIIQKTIDGGITWANDPFVFSNHLNSIVFPDNETGYIVGENGTILKTTNGGGPFGIDENVSPASIFTLYPNPATNKITLTTEKENPGETILSIISISGQQLIQARFQNQKQFELDVSKLAKGIYLLKIQNNFGSETKKLVVQ
jgi:photosystem II stability/assembly factor-like uncharacterized protein